MALGRGRGTVLVLRALGLGDLLVAVPALRGLRAAYPADRLVLAAPAGLAPLAALTGAVDELLPADGLSTPPVLTAVPEPPGLAVNLHGRGPDSTRALLRLRPGRLWAYAHPQLPAVDGPEWTDDEPEAARWCRLLAAYGVPADPVDLDLPAPPVPSPAPGAVLVHPGAAYGSRRWPADRYAAVAGALHRAGHRVVVTGGAAERPLATRVAAAAGLPADAVLAGRTGLLGLAALVEQARLVVCGDTGVGHLATAYRTPSVLVFGPTPPAQWGPPAGRPEHRVLWHGTGRRDPFGPAPDPAVLAVQVPEVLAAVMTVLDRTAAGGTAGAATAP
ncbi:MAG: glycosyltransferase family 9 protein [Mycobacteriales bacterium]